MVYGLSKIALNSVNSFAKNHVNNAFFSDFLQFDCVNIKVLFLDLAFSKITKQMVLTIEYSSLSVFSDSF